MPGYRRMRGDMIEVYRYFNRLDNDCTSNSFRLRTRLTHIISRKVKDGVRGLQQNSFYRRVTKLWNELPGNVVNAPSINRFKNELDRFWDDHPSKFKIM